MRIPMIKIFQTACCNAVALIAILLGGTIAAQAFGTVRLLGQNAEHEKITRAALGSCATRSNVCFHPKSLNEIAGKNGTWGGVGAPDNPVNKEGDRSEVHCDNSKLVECVDYMNKKMNDAVNAARGLLHWNSRPLLWKKGSIVGAEIPTIVSCTYLRQSGRAKCSVIEALGSVLHAAQDFYSHSNWSDEAGPGGVSINNPKGLNNQQIAPLLNIRNSVSVPSGLISGCFISSGLTDTRGDAKCTVTSHYLLNKDKGSIDPSRLDQPGDPTLTTARTQRGKIGTNFHKAVVAAVKDTRDKILIFKERLIARYGNEYGNRMFCAITHDKPTRTCPGG
jgi:hypothetical protein